MCYLIVLFIRVFEWLYKLVYISIQFDDKIFYNSVWASRSASIRWKYSVGNSWKFFKTFAEHLVTRVWVVFRTVVCVEFITFLLKNLHAACEFLPFMTQVYKNASVLFVRRNFMFPCSHAHSQLFNTAMHF